MNGVVSGGVYKRYDGGFYQVVDVAELGGGAESIDDLFVVYRALFGDKRLFVMRLSDFCGVGQTDRFIHMRRLTPNSREVKEAAKYGQ